MRQGDIVEDFELPDDNGTPRRLSELVKNGPVVLFFYPGALTYGCTKESCHFRDLNAEFEALGAHPVGISQDQVAKQKQFSERYSFPFPLLSDVEGTVAERFGVKRRLSFLPNRRKTFVIDSDRRLLAVISSDVSMSVHADKALDVLRSRAAAA